MKIPRLIAALGLAALLSACITPHQEDAKLRMPWPATSEPGLRAYAAPKDDYPTIGGDILKGTAPQPIADTIAAASPPPSSR